MEEKEIAMSEEPVVECARCQIPRRKRVCDDLQGVAPPGCPTLHAHDALEAAAEGYLDPATGDLARLSSRQEVAGYGEGGTSPRAHLTRIEEICDFARRACFHRLGLAFCAGLSCEAERADRIFSHAGFQVVSAVCKVGGVAKETIGLTDDEKISPGSHEAMCNPLAQAELLNRAGAELNIMLGLCVGHDALFLRHVHAPCTVLAVKDRVLAHNPLAALYTSGSYYRRLLE